MKVIDDLGYDSIMTQNGKLPYTYLGSKRGTGYSVEVFDNGGQVWWLNGHSYRAEMAPIKVVYNTGDVVYLDEHSQVTKVVAYDGKTFE